MHNQLTEKQIELLKDSLTTTFDSEYKLTNFGALNGGGYECHSYQLTINDTHHLVCKFLANDNAQERICTQRASDMDIGPCLIHHDAEDKILLLEKAQGEHLTLSQLTELDIQIAIASQLNIWHEANSQELSVQPNIIEKIDHLAKEINQETLQLLNINNLTQLLSPWINNLSDKYRVFHGDPNPTNMILLPSGTVHLIDWSTAGIGEPWVDFAMVGQYMPAAARHSWYNLITEHQGDAETKKTFQAYHYLLHLHCCFWALKQATNILNNNTQKLIDLVKSQQLTTNIPGIQNQWLKGHFKHKDPEQYILLAKLMADFCLVKENICL